MIYEELKSKKTRLNKILSAYKDMKGTKNYIEIERQLSEVKAQIKQHFIDNYRDNGK